MELYRAGEMPALIAKIREEGKKKGFELDFYGSPWGTTEGIVLIWKSDKHLVDYTVNSLMPWHESRTVICLNGE